MYDTAVLTVSLTTDGHQPWITNEAATWTEVFPFNICCFWFAYLCRITCITIYNAFALTMPYDSIYFLFGTIKLTIVYLVFNKGLEK